jgi:hypothetical protein
MPYQTGQPGKYYAGSKKCAFNQLRVLKIMKKPTSGKNIAKKDESAVKKTCKESGFSVVADEACGCMGCYELHGGTPMF